MRELDVCQNRLNSALLRVLEPLESVGPDLATRQRRLNAVCVRLLRMTVERISEIQPPLNLPPRIRETLDRLLVGESEKQIANAMGRSRHTVHVYVKAIYRRFGVCSRAELLARWVRV